MASRSGGMVVFLLAMVGTCAALKNLGPSKETPYESELSPPQYETISPITPQTETITPIIVESPDEEDAQATSEANAMDAEALAAFSSAIEAELSNEKKDQLTQSIIDAKAAIVEENAGLDEKDAMAQAEAMSAAVAASLKYQTQAAREKKDRDAVEKSHAGAKWLKWLKDSGDFSKNALAMSLSLSGLSSSEKMPCCHPTVATGMDETDRQKQSPLCATTCTQGARSDNWCESKFKCCSSDAIDKGKCDHSAIRVEHMGVEHTAGCAALDGLEFDTILAAEGNSMAIKAKMIASGQNVLVKIRVGDIPNGTAITGAEEKYLHEELIYSYLSDPVSGDSVNMMKTANAPDMDGKIRDGRCTFFREGHQPGGMNSLAGGQFIGSKIKEGYPGYYNYLEDTIVTGSEGIKTHVDFPALQACTGHDPKNPVCYIEVLELPHGVFPIGKSSSESSNLIRRAPTMRKAKALLFQVIYGLAYQFKTVGFQHWRLDETSIKTRQWPIGRKLICYLIKQSNGTADTDIGDAVRCVEKADLTYPGVKKQLNTTQNMRFTTQADENATNTATAEPTTTEALLEPGMREEASELVTTTVAPTTSGASTTPATGAQEDEEGEAIDFILSDFVGSTAGCGTSCGEACDTCGELKRIVSRSRIIPGRWSLNDRSSLLLLWAKIRPCGLSLKEDFPNMDEIETRLSLGTDCPEDQKPLLSKEVEKTWIQAIWNMPTDIDPDATEVTEDQYQAYKLHYRAVLGHEFFTSEGVQDHFDSFTSPAIDMQHCVESPDCVIRGCEPGDERCRTLSNTNQAVVNMS